MSIQKRLSTMLAESTATKKQPDQVSLIMAYENGELSDEDTIRLFGQLVKSGLAWKLQGHYGRTAKGLIDAGYISPKGAILKSEGVQLENAVFIEAKNIDVINMFINDSFPKDKKTTWGTENLKIRKESNGWSLVNYSTVIAYRPNNDDTVYFNKIKYSVTTSKIQSQIRYTAKQNGVRLTEMSEDDVVDLMASHSTPKSKAKAEPTQTSLFKKD
jgi:hypothetical protein